MPGPSKQDLKHHSLAREARRLFCQPKLRVLTRLVAAAGFRLDLTPYLEGGRIGGYVDRLNRVVVISYLDENGDLLPPCSAAFCLAHETRHLLHIKEGLFKSYYNEDYDRKKVDGSFDPFLGDHLRLVPSILVALKAEKDCDRWAEAYVRANIKSDFVISETYKASDVCGYADYCGVLSDRARRISMKETEGLGIALELLKDRVAVRRLVLHKEKLSLARGSKGKKEKIERDILSLRDALTSLIRRTGPKSLIRRHAVFKLLELMRLASLAAIPFELSSKAA